MTNILDIANEILAAGEKATARPWEAWNDMIHTGPICSADGTPTDILATCIKDNDQDERDAEYIALTANHSPDLAREVKKLTSFILARCCCKSIPVEQTCSYCEVIYRKEEP